MCLNMFTELPKEEEEGIQIGVFSDDSVFTVHPNYIENL